MESLKQKPNPQIDTFSHLEATLKDNKIHQQGRD